MPKFSFRLALIFCVVFVCFTSVFADDVEYVGQFEPTLVANKENLEQVVFKNAESLKGKMNLSADAHLAAGKLYDPKTEKASLVALISEEDDEKPVVFVDFNGDLQFSDNEKFVLKKEEADNPFLWIATINVPTQDKLFTGYQIFIRYFKTFKNNEMSDDDRLFQQTTEVFARGKVNMNGKDLLVQYTYSFADKKVNPQVEWLGVDADGNGEIDMDSLSPEAARAKNETVVFRVGQNYVSTKKADLGKNQIILRQNKAEDYKRLEVAVGSQFPDFQFTDFKGKKRNFSEFRGKYVLLDIWGVWCPACRKEFAYLRKSYRRYQPRNFEILGLNTDDEFPLEQVKGFLAKNEMNWTQAEFSSILDFLKKLRISSFPTTMLISPEGKILSMSRNDRNELDLRGKDLLKTLDEQLPQK